MSTRARLLCAAALALAALAGCDAFAPRTPEPPGGEITRFLDAHLAR